MGKDASPVDLQTQVSEDMYQRMQNKVPGASVMTKSELTRYCLGRYLELDDADKARTGVKSMETDSE